MFAKTSIAKAERYNGARGGKVLVFCTAPLLFPFRRTIPQNLLFGKRNKEPFSDLLGE